MSFISYAQNHEDVMLYRALREVKEGFYIDVGAQDPVIESVTKAFYERGWRGINIEPNEEYFHKLQDDRSRDVNLLTAVGREPGAIYFYEVAHTGLSTTNAVYARAHAEAGYEVRPRNVACTTLDRICADCGVDTVHFLKIDVEGSERAVLEGFSFEAVRPWVVVIEATEANSTREVYEEWEHLLVRRRYQFVYFDGLNRFYVAAEHSDLAGHFSCQPNPFDKYVSYHLWWARGALEQLDARAKDLERRLAESEADRAKRLENLNRMEALLAESEADRNARLATIGDLGQRLADLNQHLDASTAAHAAQSAFIARQEQFLNDTVARLQTIRASRFYNLLRSFAWYGSPPSRHGNMNHSTYSANSGSHNRRKLKRIVVDLTPLLPGGENGGAKLVATQLVSSLARIAPEIDFELLTTESNHAELAALEGANVHRVLMTHETTTQSTLLSACRWAERIALRFPEPLRRGIHAWKRNLYNLDALRTRLRSARIAIHLKHVRQDDTGDLLFCPFTAPFFHVPRRPTVAIVYDLQYIYYPYFFADEDRAERERTFRDVCRLSTKLICISDFVRTSVLQNSGLDPKRVITIHVGLDSHLREPAHDASYEFLGRYGLRNNEYLIYPANFWPHKNHAMLLTAFGMYRDRHRNSALKLACPGSLEAGTEHFAEVSRKMGLGEYVVFPGYLSDREFAKLLHASRALIFPSLFEGFGIPVLEAMAAGKPVLSSKLASLPEIAGDAALLFDPRKPEEITAAIERIVFDEKLASDLIERGYIRYSLFPDICAMAERYLQVFREAVEPLNQVANGVHGIFADNWAQQRVLINLAGCRHPRLLEIQLSGPTWWPPRGVTGTLSDGNRRNRFAIRRGQTLTICEQISTVGGSLELSFDRVFQPKHFGMERDDRYLGPLLTACRIISPEGTEDLLRTQSLQFACQR